MKQKSSSVFRLDEQVYFTFGAVFLLSVFIFAFRFASHKPCDGITVTNQASSYEKGNDISFKATASNGKNFTWDFGDGTDNITEPENVILHKFKNAGIYTVRVTTDGGCMEFQNIAITEAKVIENLAIQPTFSGPDTADVNQSVKFEDFTGGATKWEWYFEDKRIVKANTQSATYTFRTPGMKKVYLAINGRTDFTTSRSIYIIDREAINSLNREKARIKKEKSSIAPIIVQNTPNSPPLNQPVVVQETPKKEEEKPIVRAPDMTNAQMSDLLKAYVDGAKQREEFMAYICNKSSMSIAYNSKTISFSGMLDDLKTLKKKKIKDIHVILIKDGGTNCISGMTVNVEMKKGFLGL